MGPSNKRNRTYTMVFQHVEGKLLVFVTDGHGVRGREEIKGCLAKLDMKSRLGYESNRGSEYRGNIWCRNQGLTLIAA